MAAAIASVAPTVTSTSEAGSKRWPQRAARSSAMAARRSAIPRPGGYWLLPPAICSRAISNIRGGPSQSGNPCPRFTAACRWASSVISAKIVPPNSRSRPTTTDP